MIQRLISMAPGGKWAVFFPGFLVLAVVCGSSLVPCWGQSFPLLATASSDKGSHVAESGEEAGPAAEQQVPVVRTTVRVSAVPEGFTTRDPSPQPFQMSGEQIGSSAGTFGDVTRYLRNLPGVIGGGNWSDDVIVRGGNPMENLFLVDGIEVPNINQVSLEQSAGGLLSMIDAPAIQNVEFYTGGYDARYAERLSSVVDIHTREALDRKRHGEGNFGYIGAGGLALMPFGQTGSMFGSFHRSLLNLVTNDIGLGGTPVYSNLLLAGGVNPSERDQLTFLSLSGWDSINIAPGGPGHYYKQQTDFIDEQYAGWRSTSGVRWQHVYSPRRLGVLTVSDSEQESNIVQENQLLATGSENSAGSVPPLVYSQRSDDGRATLRYDFVFDAGRSFSGIAGGMVSLNRVNYSIAQPLGEQSPLSTDPAATDADSFAPNFVSGESGWYTEMTYHPSARWSVSGGGRVQSFALGGHWTATPRVSTAVRLSRYTGLHAAFGEYAQMPPTVYLTAWPQNHALLPMRVRHLVAGVDLYSGPHGRIGVEAYEKRYWDYPASTQYPSLSLANMIDDLEGEILWIPLASSGTGLSRGVECSAAASLFSHLTVQVSAAYSHTNYAGEDGVMRPGDFDYPIAAGTSGTYRSGKHYEASWHYQYTSGHPYTPFLFPKSKEQNRPIYDVTRINALRGPVYSRLDFEADRSFWIGSRRLVVYGGVDNAWNRQNFLGYNWMPHMGANSGCGVTCYEEAFDDFSRFPDGGLRYIF